MTGTRHETRHETHPAIGTHRDHEDDPHGGADDSDLCAGLPNGSGRVPSHGEIGSLIVVTAAANLRLAHWRVTDRRPADHGDDAVGRRSH
ncbi:hypothetical protein OG806_36665 [Streptomyces sp. NBC_00882]|uniref:hypothetical protein n=1 Tax=Streptomyces TaxID=1883 RepID=UPI0038696C73|nr:hypothetical protein OG806_36665 [Streptomyces sp. NBC_00882]WSZ61436.1 hypothetical protein OH824_35215 [Streptomyces canus]